MATCSGVRRVATHLAECTIFYEGGAEGLRGAARPTRSGSRKCTWHVRDYKLCSRPPHTSVQACEPTLASRIAKNMAQLTSFGRRAPLTPFGSPERLTQPPAGSYSSCFHSPSPSRMSQRRTALLPFSQQEEDHLTCMLLGLYVHQELEDKLGLVLCDLIASFLVA